MVKQYQQVKSGDIIGTVGNSGNARYTPPHLHFGVYAYQNVHDPFYYLAETIDDLKTITSNRNFLGQWMIVSDYSENALENNELFHKPVKVVALTGNQYRIQFTDKSKIFFSGDLLPIDDKMMYAEALFLVE